MTTVIFLSTPSARRATEYLGTAPITIQFLSTPSARRATYTQEWFVKVLHEFLSTPSSRRATHIDLARDLACDISIHALLTEGDLCPWSGIVFAHISIHALLTEGD